MKRAASVIAWLLFLAACSSGGAPPPPASAVTEPAAATARPARASSKAAPSTRPSPVPSMPSEAPVPGGLEVGHIAQVVTTDLVVRSLPRISDASVVDPATVPIGFLAYIVDGPVAADGYDWYQVAPFPPTMSDVVEEHPRFGWLAAAGKDGAPWIAPWDGECPQPGWDGMMLSQRYVMLACWAGVDQALEGTLRSCDNDGATGGEPAWLHSAPCRLVGPDYGQLLAAGLALHFAPGVPVTLCPCAVAHADTTKS